VRVCSGYRLLLAVWNAIPFCQAKGLLPMDAGPEPKAHKHDASCNHEDDEWEGDPDTVRTTLLDRVLCYDLLCFAMSALRVRSMLPLYLRMKRTLRP
jgi:hypothetical protein